MLRIRCQAATWLASRSSGVRQGDPVLGICWYPAAHGATFVFLMALTVGLLLFIGIDAISELEVAAPGRAVPGVGPCTGS
jgi:hypothetical protein